MRHVLHSFCAVVVLLLAASVLAAPPVLDTPAISCAAGGSGVSVNIVVTAGASGAPSGFAVQWLLRSEYELHGWSGNGSSFCEASFSSGVKRSPYGLAPGESATIAIGEPFTTAGASSRCDGSALQCGQTYAFRVVATGSKTETASAWSEATFCSTMSCATALSAARPGVSGCTHPATYWAVSGPSSEERRWPVQGGLMLGNRFYTESEIESLMESASTGRGVVELSHQLIAAKLNVANGATDPFIDEKIRDADAAIGNVDVTRSKLAPGQAAPHIEALLAFNQGVTGPGACE